VRGERENGRQRKLRYPELLIETDALERQLGDPVLRVFDCTTNRIPDQTTYPAVPARAEFETGHIGS
jgi:hypothetical protein